ADQNPRLRFWHWYNFSCADYGYVQIKAGTNNWVNLETFTGYSGGTWSYPCFDLSLYAGQSVQLGFYLLSQHAGFCGGDVAAGWYIDELAVLTGPLHTLTVESFEQTNFWERWCADNGTWEWGMPTSGPGAAHSGPKCVATILDGNYGDSTSSRLVSPAFMVPSVDQNPRLRFWHWFNFSCADYGQIEIRSSDAPWQTLTNYSSNSGGEWTEPEINLSAYAGQSAQIGFQLVSQHAGFCGSDVGPGWYIDDVFIQKGNLRIASISAKTNAEETAITFSISNNVVGPHSDRCLSFDLPWPPPGATIEPETGLFNWT